MIPAVSRATTPGGLDTLLERRFTVELHAASWLRSQGCTSCRESCDRGGSITQRRLQRLLESDGYDVAGEANEAAGFELLRDASPVAVVLELHRSPSEALARVRGASVLAYDGEGRLRFR